MIQGGDNVYHDVQGGNESIYGRTFYDEFSHAGYFNLEFVFYFLNV